VAYHIEIREKVSPETIGIRIHDLAKSDFPIVKGDPLENCYGCGELLIGE
jgi:hypothetical protein